MERKTKTEIWVKPFLKSTWFWKAPDSSPTSLPSFVGKLSLNLNQSSKTSLQLLCWKQTDFGIQHFFIFAPPTPPPKHKCHGQGANSLQLAFYLPGPDTCAKTGGQFQWPTARTVCAMTNVCKTHVRLLSLSIWTKKQKLTTEKF